MEQYLFNISEPREDIGEAAVRPNVWLLSADEVPPILFSADDVARVLGIGRCKVFDLIRYNELRSVKVGSYRRVSAKALAEYVSRLEFGEPA